MIETRSDIAFDTASAALRARRTRRLGSLVLAEQTLPVPATAEAAAVLAEAIAALGIDRLPWTKALTQWRDRVMFLRRAEGEPWPDLSDQALAQTAKDWLAPHLTGKTSLAAIGARGSRPCPAGAAAVGFGAPARRRSADPFRSADRLARRRRLRGGGRPGSGDPRAGTLWPRHGIPRSPAVGCR